jgi:shikimate dehydrogenase
VLGGGATAASALFALADLGCETATLLVREPARAAETLTAVRRHPRPPAVEVVRLAGPVAAPVGEPVGERVADRAADRVASSFDILVSTIPAAAQDGAVLGLAERATVVFEVVYDPWPTPLAAAAIAAGRPLVSGLDLLVQQAGIQVELMTGVARAPLKAMRAAGEAALAQRWG